MDGMQLLFELSKHFHVFIQQDLHFFLFLWICRYTHAANGTCSGWVGAGGSNHKYKSPTVPLICYFGISLHIWELLEVFSSSVILRSHLILPEMLLP